MAEKKGVGHAYNVDFLNVVFAASSLFLFLSVIWMVWDDYDREWKNTQRRFVELEYQVTQAQLAAGDARRSTRTSCSSSRRSARRRRRTSRPTSRRSTSCRRKLKEADARLYRATHDYQFPRRPTTRTATTSRRRAPTSSSSAEKQGRSDAEELDSGSTS